MATKSKSRMGAGTEHSTDLRLEPTATTTESAGSMRTGARVGVRRHLAARWVDTLSGPGPPYSALIGPTTSVASI